MATSSRDVTDFMGFQGLLTDEERMVRRQARQFVNAEVLPVIENHAQEQTFPHGLIRPMGELGFYGPTLPAKYGCAGVSSVAHGLLMYELERGDSGIRSFASVQGSLVMYPIFAYGSEAQKDRWLPRLARGEAVGCFGLTEPGCERGRCARRAAAGGSAGRRCGSRTARSRTWRSSGPAPTTGSAASSSSAGRP